jgi:protein-disulfide isomerase
VTKFLFTAFVIAMAYSLFTSWSEHKQVQVLYADLKSNPSIPMAGDPQGDVTVIEFFDYKCGYCKLEENAFATLLQEDPHLRVVFMELPIFGEHSITAAKAALAVNRIDSKKYFAFHHALMEKNEALTMSLLEQEAAKLGISATALGDAMENPEITLQLSHIREQAHSMGILGTPGLVIGDHIIKGSLPTESLRKEIAAVRK